MLPLRKKCQVRNVLVCKPRGYFREKIFAIFKKRFTHARTLSKDFFKFKKRKYNIKDKTQKLSPKIFLISKNGKKY